MHETGLCEAIVDEVERAAGGRRVERIRVRVGEAHGVVAEDLAAAFRMTAAGTVAEEAEVDLVIEPLAARCMSCGAETAGSPAALVACPGCGGVNVEITGGDEVVLDSISVALAGPARRRDWMPSSC